MKRILHLLLGALVMLAGVELLLQVLPVSTATHTGYYIHPNILTNPPYHHWTMATGWDLRDAQKLRANNYGFAAEHDFQPGTQAIGLVGDSYVEASMLPLADRPAAQLERALGGQRPVYAMGGPGSSLLDYAERIRWAHESLGLRDFVVLMESTDASQAACNSGNVHARCLDPRQLTPVLMRRPPSGWAKDILRESALAQYLVSQLKVSGARLSSPDFWHSGAPDTDAHKQQKPAPSAAGPVALPLSRERQAMVDAAVDEFLRQMDSLQNVRLVFALDMNRSNLEPGVQRPDEVYHVAQRLRSAGFPVAEGEPLYREHLRASPRRLAMGPHDGHLNAIGVGLLMTAAARTAQKNGFTDITERGN
jgi:hypothetical protein